jgi:hypothetical protein
MTSRRSDESITESDQPSIDAGDQDDPHAGSRSPTGAEKSGHPTGVRQAAQNREDDPPA